MFQFYVEMETGEEFHLQVWEENLELALASLKRSMARRYPGIAYSHLEEGNTWKKKLNIKSPMNDVA